MTQSSENATEMKLVLSPPEWKASLKYFSLKLAWDPTIDLSLKSDTVLELPVSDKNGPMTDDNMTKCINIIVKTLISQGTRWFAKPLQEKNILNKLKHTYIFDFEGAKPDPPFQINWIPTELHVLSSQFILVWGIKDYHEIKSHIPLSFLDDDSEIQEVDVLSSVPQVSDDVFTLKENENKKNQRELIKAARVKAAIAKYKAELLVQEYNELYGDLSDSEEEESDDESVGDTDQES